MCRRNLVREDGLDLLLDLHPAVVRPTDDDVEEKMREELLSDDGIFEVEEAGEGVEDLLGCRALDLLEEVVGEGADPVAVDGRRAVDRVLSWRHRLEIPEGEAGAEEGCASLDDRLGKRSPAGKGDLVGGGHVGVGSEDEVGGETAETEELLDCIGEELLMLRVVGASVRADEEVLNEAEGEVDGFGGVEEVLEDDGRLLDGWELETIRVEGAEDTDALEGGVANELVLRSVLDGGTEEDGDGSTDKRVERVTRREGSDRLGALLEDDLELAKGLKRNDVVLAGDAVEEVGAASLEGPARPCSDEDAVRGFEPFDAAEVGDVLEVNLKARRVLDDEVLDRHLRRRPFRFRQVGPETDEGGGSRTHEGTDVAELERTEEGPERVEGDETETGELEGGL